MKILLITYYFLGKDWKNSHHNSEKCVANRNLYVLPLNNTSKCMCKVSKKFRKIDLLENILQNSVSFQNSHIQISEKKRS